MNLKTFRSHAGEGLVLVRNVLTSDNCPKDGVESRSVKWRLLQTIADTTSIGICGGKEFEELKLFYDGSSWAVEMKAIVSEALTNI